MKSARCCRRLRTCWAESSTASVIRRRIHRRPAARECPTAESEATQNIGGHDQRSVAFQMSVRVVDKLQIVANTR